MTETERRQSFRIDDQARLEWQLLGSDAPNQPLEHYLPSCAGYQLLSELQHLDQELQLQLFKLSETQAALSQALRLINNKIERIAMHVSDDLQSQPLQPISLSEGGLSLFHDQPLKPGDYLAVRLCLNPSGYALQSFARVIYSLEQQEQYRIGLAFVELNHPGSDLIARHLLEQQAALRRLTREQQESP